MTTNVKIGIAAAVLLAGGVFLYMRRKKPAASGTVEAQAAARETYYGGSGRCFQTSDDAEVPVARCAERGVSVGVPAMPAIISWFTGANS